MQTISLRDQFANSNNIDDKQRNEGRNQFFCWMNRGHKNIRRFKEEEEGRKSALKESRVSRRDQRDSSRRILVFQIKGKFEIPTTCSKRRAFHHLFSLPSLSTFVLNRVSPSFVRTRFLSPFISL